MTFALWTCFFLVVSIWALGTVGAVRDAWFANERNPLVYAVCALWPFALLLCLVSHRMWRWFERRFL